MSYVDGNRPAPLGAITIYRTTEALGGLLALLRSTRRRRDRRMTAFSPAQLEDMGLSVADIAAPRRPGALSRAAEALRDWSARRRTIAALERLTDAQLQDVGLTRGHIYDLRCGRPLV